MIGFRAHAPSVSNLVRRPGESGLRFGQHRVAVVDYFAGKTTDIDGDGIADLSHGETIQRLIKSLVPDTELVPFPVGGPPDAIDPAWVTRQLKEIINGLKRGERFDAVNMSLATMTKAKPLDGLNRREILRWMRGQKSSHPFQFRALGTIRAIEEITRRGVPVYIGSGNDGPDYLNLYTLARGAVTVGATNARHEKADYSAHNRFINRWSQGTFNVFKTPGGYNYLPDHPLDTPMVSDSEVSGNLANMPRWQHPFIGRPLSEITATPSEITQWDKALKTDKIRPDRLPAMNARIFPLASLKTLGWVDQDTANQYEPMGDYLVLQDGRIKGALRQSPTGTALYSPDGSTRTTAHHHLYGTSLAAPHALATDLLQKQ